ncbi:hypothetical protein NMY22_g380 [Coprinellus aureogranulatus]|nr:hypothetical protein NMY22_g380 [Coprinellus aureogranulatus]
MVALFQRKGLTSGFEYSSLSEQFADVMSGSGRGLFKSSWNLKQFVQVKTDDPTEEFHMIPSIRVDYGFVNCKSDAEFKLLLKVYQEYFQSDMNNCVHLHAACIKGELFEYLGKFTKVPLTQQHRRLMKNPYPLLDLCVRAHSAKVAKFSECIGDPVAETRLAMFEQHYCDCCGDAEGKFTCSGCKKRRYCGEECQKRAWEVHIFECDTRKPIKSYNHLARDVILDEIPSNPQTREDFGFNRADLSPESGMDGSQRLFGLYVGLIKILGVSAKTVDQWRRNGTLLEEIKKKYEPIPEDFRGLYYPWLLRNQFVLDRSMPIPRR